MAFNFALLIAHMAQTRNVRAGSVVGASIASIVGASHGYASIAEQRAREIVVHGEQVTAFMRFGDSVRIDLSGADGNAVTGAIEQKVSRLGACQIFCVERGHEIIRKGLFHD